MIELQYLLLMVFSLGCALFFKPIKKYKDYHLLIFGIVISIIGIMASVVFGRDATEVILLEDTWGPGRSVILGYAITIGVFIRMAVKSVISKVE